MKRDAIEFLRNWKHKPSRKPLVIRGARQVGKSWLARLFSREAFENSVEINFENEPDAASFFTYADPAETVRLLQVRYNTEIRPGHTLLFLDQIQSAPAIFAKLRYFYEKLPALHVMAAGSLLDFILEDHAFSMPVGRIEYLHLGPMSFQEFLSACSQSGLLKFLKTYSINDDLPAEIHYRLVDLLKKYFAIGGMPESQSVFTARQDIVDPIFWTTC